MKVLHITANYKGGAGIAAFRLHNSLLEIGVESSFMSKGSEPLIDINGNPSILMNTRLPFYKRIIKKITKKLNILHPLKVAEKRIQKRLQCSINSLPISDDNIFKSLDINKYDIIHLHALQHTLDYGSFFRKLSKPIVWTLHDINPIAGIFHLRSDEYRNKDLAAKLNSDVINYKIKCYNHIKKGAIVAPSEWLCRESLTRGMFKKFDHYKIPNPIPKVYFNHIGKKKLKIKYNIPQNKRIILFVASNPNDQNKGLDLLTKAISMFDSTSIHLLIVGECNHNLYNKFSSTLFGFIQNDSIMSEIYKIADIFVIPSLDENLPNTMLESLASGTPVVGFKIGGVNEYIISGVNGELAESIDYKSLYHAICNALNDSSSYNRIEIQDEIYNFVNPTKVATSYLKIYESILS